MTELGRRDLLQGAGVVGATLALSSLPAIRPASAAEHLRFFSESEAGFVRAAIDRLIPPDPEWSGAVDANVLDYIDLQLAGPYGKGARLYLEGPFRQGASSQGYQLGLTPADLYRQSISGIFGHLKTRGLDFASASEADRDDFLGALERGEIPIEGFSSAIFFETLLANTIEGWFADPAYGGNREMVAWRMVGFPGAYAAWLGVYTNHGVRVTRPPIPMAAGHGQVHPAQPGQP